MTSHVLSLLGIRPTNSGVFRRTDPAVAAKQAAREFLAAFVYREHPKNPKKLKLEFNPFWSDMQLKKHMQRVVSKGLHPKKRLELMATRTRNQTPKNEVIFALQALYFADQLAAADCNHTCNEQLPRIQKLLDDAAKLDIWKDVIKTVPKPAKYSAFGLK